MPPIFRAAENGHSLTPEKYDAELPRLRARLLEAHHALREQKFPVIVIVSGADGAGKGELVHRLNEWLDPRGVATHAFWRPSDEERERPAFWRFWRAMPGRGRIGIFFGSWYTEPVIERVYGRMKKKAFEAELDRIAAFEKMLADDRTVFVKLRLHLSKREQKRRLKKLERDGRIGPEDWQHFQLYDKFNKVSARSLVRTDLPHARWHVIEATDRRYREIAAGQVLLEALEQALAAAAKPVSAARRVAAARRAADRLAPKRGHLSRLDLAQRLDDDAYGDELAKYQSRLSQLAWEAQDRGVSTVLAFEGWDAAGKGSAIKRVTEAIDPRLYRVVGVPAPTDEERAQHYLWRFWRQLPRAGYLTIFDRSWYGRVLVERVEGFATPAEWGRAYTEINAFEEQLADRGIVLGKFWIHISPEEQLQRFKERETVAYKRYKITEEDWRNRKKWPDYQHAVEDMVTCCDTPCAPWTIVPGNDKKFARVQILKTIVQRLESALEE